MPLFPGHGDTHLPLTWDIDESANPCQSGSRDVVKSATNGKGKILFPTWLHILTVGARPCPRKTWDYVGNWETRSHWKFENFADKMSVQHVPKSRKIHIFNQILLNCCMHIYIDSNSMGFGYKLLFMPNSSFTKLLFYIQITVHLKNCKEMRCL